MLGGPCVVVAAVATAFAAYFGGIQAEVARRIREPLARAHIEGVPTEQNDSRNMLFPLSCKSHGQIPARNMRLPFLSHSERSPSETIYPLLKAHEGRYSLGRDQPFGYKVRLGLTGDDCRALVGSCGQRHVYTSSIHEDIFDRPHHANFCFVLRPQDDSAPFTPCEFFNDAD